MKRLMVIPAAGSGSRLESALPKALYPVLGRPMLAYLFDLYAPMVDRFVVVVNPSSETVVRAFCETLEVPVEFAIQESPTGMLDAIMIASAVVRRDQPDEVWITWCDQIAVSPKTVQRLADVDAANAQIDLVMPTIVTPEPYIHWVRNAEGKISGVLQRREGDVMPDVGEGDIGLFCLSRRAYLELLPQFAREAARGGATQETNFLPFIPWLVARHSLGTPVQTFPATATMEAIGINTQADVARIERYLSDA